MIVQKSGLAAALALSAVWVGFAARVAMGQQIDADVTPPVVDRWMYPFGSEVGTRATVPVFSSANRCGPDERFDDRDAQMLVTFATSGAVEAGWPAGAYRVQAVTMRVRTSDATAFRYDGTADAIETFLAPGNPGEPCPADAEFVADADAGRPIELFAVAFRNGFTAATYGENSQFKPGMAFTPPWINVRNAYPIWFDDEGAAVDGSNPQKERRLGRALALGQSASAVPGEIVPDGTEFSFGVDLGLPGVTAYFQRGLAEGRVALLMTALFESEEQTVGSYPNIYTKEAIPLLFPNAAPPRLVVSVYLCKADFNGDGERNPDDLADFITCFFLDVQFPGFCGQADFNHDGFRDPDDLADFITSFFLGCE